MNTLATIGRTLGLGLTLLLCGCVPLQVRLQMDQLASSGIPVINAHMLRGEPGRYELHSGVRAQGPVADPPQWTELEIGLRLQRLRLTVETPAADRSAIQRLLARERDGCESTNSLLRRGLQVAEARMAEWMASSSWPRIVIRLVGDGQGIHVQQTSQGTDIESLMLYLGRPVVAIENCSVQAMFASDIAEMVIHEVTHISNQQRFGKRIDAVTNEFMAYATQLCLRLEVSGRIPFPVVSVPGLEINRDNILEDRRFWELVESGTMPSSLAGFILADSMRSRVFGPRMLTSEDVQRMNQVCRDLHRLERPSVRSQATRNIYSGRAELQTL